MKRYHLILAGLLALAANACAPQVDVEAEKNAIREMDREWENATNANGAEGWVSFVTEDAVLYPPNHPIVRGKEAIGEYMQTQFPPDSPVRWKPDHIEVSSAGDMAFMFGTYEIAVIGPEGDPVSSTGKYGNAWTKMPDGTWIAVASVWNSELPLPGVAATFLSTTIAKDAVKADPHHYTVEFENDRVRVIRIKYGPGEKSVMHSHGPHVSIFLTDNTVRMTLPDGTSSEVTGEAGATLWTDADDHLPENLSDKPFELVLVELKE